MHQILKRQSERKAEGAGGADSQPGMWLAWRMPVLQLMKNS